MKHTKKIIAAIAALTMTMSTMTSVFAESTVTIEGETSYIDQTVYKVTLPTAAGMKFTLDPQGLTALAGTGSTGQEGIITGAGVMAAKNESSVDVKLTAKFYLTDTGSGNPKAVITGNAVASSSTGNAIQLVIKGDKNITSDIVAEDPPTTPASVAAASFSNDLVTVTGTSAAAPSTFSAVMKKADWSPSADAVTKKPFMAKDNENEASQLVMTIGGTLAGKGDWSKYADGTNKLTLTAVFKFEKTDSTDEIVNTTVNGSGSVAGATKVTKTNSTVTWTDRSKALVLDIDAASFNQPGVADVGVILDGTVFGYAGTWDGWTNLKDNGHMSLSGTTLTVNPKLGSVFEKDNGFTIYVKGSADSPKADFSITVNYE